MLHTVIPGEILSHSGILSQVSRGNCLFKNIDNERFHAKNIPSRKIQYKYNKMRQALGRPNRNDCLIGRPAAIQTLHYVTNIQFQYIQLRMLSATPWEMPFLPVL